MSTRVLGTFLTHELPFCTLVMCYTIVMLALSATLPSVEAASLINAYGADGVSPVVVDAVQPYNGGVFSRTQNRIYLVPFDQGSAATWHYIDCETGRVIGYSHNASLAASKAYAGGVYSPSEDRIYFVPFRQASLDTWHYVDCSTGAIVGYAHNKLVNSEAYNGGVYSPTDDRIYLVPYNVSGQDAVHYIDTNSPEGNPPLVGGLGITDDGGFLYAGYVGGVYSPIQNRVYFVPFRAAVSTNWHYINCTTDAVDTYEHGLGLALPVEAYKGGVYSVEQGRIYFVPYAHAGSASWHYISSTGTVVAYANHINGNGGANCPTSVRAYDGGVLDLVRNRIYFVPHGDTGCNSFTGCNIPNNPNPMRWHYIDCANDRVENYTVDSIACTGTAGTGDGELATNAYSGGVATTDKVYFMPNLQAHRNTWHYVNVGTASPTLSPTTSEPTTSNPTVSPTSEPTTSNPTVSPTDVLALSDIAACTARLDDLERRAASVSYAPGKATTVQSLFAAGDGCPNRSVLLFGGAVDRDDDITFELVIDNVNLGEHYETCVVDRTGRFTVTLDDSMPLGQHTARINARAISPASGATVKIPVASWTMDVRTQGALGLTANGTAQQQLLERYVAENIVNQRFDVNDSITFPGFDLSSDTLDSLFVNYTRNVDDNAMVTLTVSSCFGVDGCDPGLQNNGVSLGENLFVISTSGKMLLKADVPGKHRITLQAASGNAQPLTVLGWNMHIRSGPGGRPCDDDHGVVTDDDADQFNRTYVCTCTDGFIGANCDTPPTEVTAAEPDTASQVAVIVAVAVAGVLLAGILVGIVRLRHQKRKLNVPFNFSEAVALLLLDGKTGSSIDGGTGEDAEGEDNSAARVMPEELPRSSVVLINELGHGQFGTVHKALYKPPRTAPSHAAPLVVNNRLHNGKGAAAKPTFEYTVAVKSLKVAPTPDTKADFMREAAITAQFNHPNVVGLIGVVTKADPCLLVLQFCENGALDVIVGTRDIAPDLLCTYSWHIALGMAYLSSRRFVHRDLASRNVLVDTRDQAKIADFGMSRDVEDSAYYTASDTNARMPLRWMAPEVFTSHKFGEASDVWSFGVTVVEIFTRAETPYTGWTNLFVCERVKGGYILPCPPTCPAALYAEVVAPCFSQDPHDRPSFHSLCSLLESMSKLEVAPTSSPPPEEPVLQVTKRRTAQDSSMVNNRYDRLVGGAVANNAALPLQAKPENHGVVYQSGGDVAAVPAVDARYTIPSKEGRANAGKSAALAEDANYDNAAAGPAIDGKTGKKDPYGRLGAERITNAAYAVLDTVNYVPLNQAPSTGYVPLKQAQTSSTAYATLGTADGRDSDEWAPQPYARRPTMWQHPPVNETGRTVERDAQGRRRLTPAYKESPKYQSMVKGSPNDQSIVKGSYQSIVKGPKYQSGDVTNMVFNAYEIPGTVSDAPLNQAQTSSTAPQQPRADSNNAHRGDVNPATPTGVSGTPGAKAPPPTQLRVDLQRYERERPPDPYAIAVYAMANGNEADESAASVDVDPPVTYALASRDGPGQYDVLKLATSQVPPGDFDNSPAGSTTTTAAALTAQAVHAPVPRHDGDTYLDFVPRYALPVDHL